MSPPARTPGHPSQPPRHVARQGETADQSDHDVTTDAKGQVNDGVTESGVTWSPTPARGYSWPPFEPGHTLRLVHGAEHPATLEARAAELRPRLFELCPWLEEVDAIAVARFLRVEARSLILESYMAEVIGQSGPGKVPIRMWEQANATDRLAADLGGKLGLDAAGRAELRQTVASTKATLEGLAQKGAEINRRRDAQVISIDGTEDEPA